VRLRTLALCLVLVPAALVGIPAGVASGAPERLPCQLPRSMATAAPVAVGVGCAGVRPGAKLENTYGFCTFGFVFATRDDAPSTGIADGSIYIASAGHCSYPSVVVDDGVDREDKWSGTSGPVYSAFDENGDPYPVGTAVYAVKTGTKDLTLVRLFSGVHYSAQVCHFGGPTALNDDVTGTPTVIHHYGQGLGVGNVLPGRTALAANGLDDPDYVYALGVVLPGDSGSPVTDDFGRALGQAGHIIVSGNPLQPGTFSFNRLDAELDRAHDVLHTRFRLVTAAAL